MASGTVVAGTSLLAKVDKPSDVAADRVVVEVTGAEYTLPVEPGRSVPLVVALTETVPSFDPDEDGGGGRLPDSDDLMEGAEFMDAVPRTEGEDAPFPFEPVPKRRFEGPEPTGDTERYEEPLPTGGTGDRVEPVLTGGATGFNVPTDGPFPLGGLYPVPTGRRDEPDLFGDPGRREELAPGRRRRVRRFERCRFNRKGGPSD